MPRRNENAFQNPQHRKLSRWDRGYQPIGAEMSLEMSRSNPPQGGSGVPNKNIKPPRYDVVGEGNNPRRTYSTIKTTPEQIVRDHRNSVADLIQTPSIQKVYSAPWYKAIEWDLVINRACWAALIGCLVYLGIIVFAPFTIKLLK